MHRQVFDIPHLRPARKILELAAGYWSQSSVAIDRGQQSVTQCALTRVDDNALHFTTDTQRLRRCPAASNFPPCNDDCRRSCEAVEQVGGCRPRHDAYLQSDLTPISATLPGYVGSVPVQDYQRVHAGCSDSRDPTPGERPCLIPCPPRTA